MKQDMKKLLTATFLLLLTLTVSAQEPWGITASDIDASNYFGATVANGQIGLTSAAEPLRNATVVVGGCYDGDAKSSIPSFFDNIHMMDMTLKIDGETAAIGNISGYSQRLDMRKAQMTANFSLGKKAEVSYRQMALRQLPFSAMTIVEVKAKSDITLEATNEHVCPSNLQDAHGRYRLLKKKRGNIYLLSTDAKSYSGRHKVTGSTSFVFFDRNYPTVTTDSTRSMTLTVKLKRGTTYRFGVVGSIATSQSHQDTPNEADRLTIFATLTGADNLEAEHIVEWDRLWASDIEIDGDPQAQQDVRSMLYNLYSYVREDSRHSISPMGLSSAGYHGHIFWDADLWMYPALLVMHPQMAKSMIDYRIDRLTAACRNAYSHGYRGTMFPWESSESGMEDTPSWATTGTNEHHITGCVALAAWQYFAVSRDTAWLRREAWPLLRQTADFWLSRATKDKTGWHIRNVVCADEYATNVDDNAFTNAIAMENLRIACLAAELAGEKADPRWKQLSTALPILKMDDGTTREHATYNGETIKQADVNLLAYPLHTITDPKQIRRDLDYYEKKIGGSLAPAMTEAIFSLLHSRLGNGKEAGRLFRQAYEQNLCPPLRVIAECKGGKNPYFVTGAGGIIQTVLMGFAGYEITDNGLKQNAPGTLPTGWKSVTVKRAE